MMIAIPFAGMILYIIACWLMGFLGKNGRLGFWGNFWVSVIFTPIIGLLIVLVQANATPKIKQQPDDVSE